MTKSNMMHQAQFEAQLEEDWDLRLGPDGQYAWPFLRSLYVAWLELHLEWLSEQSR